MYYPTVTMVLWAFVTIYLQPTSDFLRDAPGLFIGAVLLWDVLFRGQLGVSLTFVEEMYARNLGNLMMSYAPTAPDKALLTDLKKLLRLSHIG